MKKIIAIFSIIITLASCSATSQVGSNSYSDVSFNTFYNELSPYGRWVNYPSYGQVWISNETGFEPYSTRGHWDYTNYGWMWVSDYSWGWAPFHYGRWAYLNNYGWAWVPGYEWAPAWVGWCNYDGYYGWAPLSPGFGFNNYSFSSMPVNYWRFVQPQYINNHNINRYYQRPVRNANQYNNVTVINNTIINNNTYIAGPARQDIEKATKKTIEPKQITFREEGVKKTEVVNKKEIRVFRPAVKQNAVADNMKPPMQQPIPVNKNDAVNTPKVNVDAPAKEQLITKQEAIQQQQMQPAIKINEQEQAARQQKQQDDIQRQQAIQQQNELKNQQRQEQVRLQNEARVQQQNEARMQQRQQQLRQQQERQNEMRQQRKEQAPVKQQEFNQPRSFPKAETHILSPAKQKRKE